MAQSEPFIFEKDNKRDVKLKNSISRFRFQLIADQQQRGTHINEYPFAFSFQFSASFFR